MQDGVLLWSSVANVTAASAATTIWLRSGWLTAAPTTAPAELRRVERLRSSLSTNGPSTVATSEWLPATAAAAAATHDQPKQWADDPKQPSGRTSRQRRGGRWRLTQRTADDRAESTLVRAGSTKPRWILGAAGVFHPRRNLLDAGRRIEVSLRAMQHQLRK